MKDYLMKLSVKSASAPSAGEGKPSEDSPQNKGVSGMVLHHFENWRTSGSAKTEGGRVAVNNNKGMTYWRGTGLDSLQRTWL